MGYHVNPSDIIAMPIAPLGRYVLLVMNDYGWPCWPSLDKLSEKSGVPRRTLQTVLGHLRKGGFLNSSGTGKALTWELLQVPEGVRRNGAVRRRSGASPAPLRRTTCAVTARGSELMNEPMNEPRRRQQLGELPPAGGDRPLGFAEAAALFPKLAQYARTSAGVPPAGVGHSHATTDPRALAEAGERLEALRAGRLYA